MRRLARLSPGTLAALTTLVVVAVVFAIGGGGMFSPGELNSDNHSNSRRGNVSSHAELGGNCSACHAPFWSNDSMADRCLVCHQEVRQEIAARSPLHGTLSAGTRCQQCHTEHKGAHAALTDLSHFDHNCAAFKLTGAHQRIDCFACHQQGTFKGTVQTCVGCHVEPKVPTVHKGNYGTRCEQCHSTASWGGTNLPAFDHNRTAFQLTGKHVSVNCSQCHVNNVFKGTPQTCVGCHSEPAVPSVHKGNYGTRCDQCHSTASWRSANPRNFDHSRTAFQLTGKHVGANCNQCHVNNVFKGTPQTCVACHAEPKVPDVHKNRYSTNCVQCHTTATWKEATFKHTFPINHGNKKKGNNCATCHSDPNNLTVYTCYNCHEHRPDKIREKHVKKGILKYENCTDCHATGRKHEKGKKEKKAFDFSDLAGCLDGDMCTSTDGCARCPNDANVTGILEFAATMFPVAVQTEKRDEPTVSLDSLENSRLAPSKETITGAVLTRLTEFPPVETMIQEQQDPSIKLNPTGADGPNRSTWRCPRGPPTDAKGWRLFLWLALHQSQDLCFDQEVDVPSLGSRFSQPSPLPKRGRR